MKKRNSEVINYRGGADFGEVVALVQGNAELVKGLLGSDLLKDKQVRAALAGLLRMVAKKLMR